MNNNKLLHSIKTHSKRYNTTNDLTPILEEIGDANIVLLGEASHGTKEFYTTRTELTKKLIQEKGFNIICVEGDWPACQEINRYIKGYNHSNEDPLKVLKAFDRWPTWMWANEEIADLVEWTKAFNKTSELKNKVGFYGIDVYSLWESMEEIIAYLKKTNSPDLQKAQEAFSCFEPHNRDPQKYAISSAIYSEGCLEEITQLLTSIRTNKELYNSEYEQSLNLEVNALVTANAEKYYSMMALSDTESWNVRDQHMVEAINTVMNFYGQDAKVIVWAHNTHVGDARATDMKKQGMINIGQLIREQYGRDKVYIVGFGTNHGEVIAADQWGLPFQSMTVPPARLGSWEDLLYKVSAENQILLFNKENRHLFEETIGHRAIGVVYQPQYEQYGNYVPTSISHRYDSFIFINETHSLNPLAIETALL